MDRVPRAFHEHVCGRLSIVGLSGAKELSGSYGKIARLAFDHLSSYICTVEDGCQIAEYVFYRHPDRGMEVAEDIEAVPKKFVQSVMIRLEDAEDESVSREVVQRFPYAQEYIFILESSSISKASVDFAYSLKRLATVAIEKKLDDDALRLLQKLVTGQNLWFFFIHPDACEGIAMEMTKSLLCQEQFQELQIKEASRFGSWKTTPVQEILELWSENSEKLRGKHVIVDDYCGQGIKQLEDFLVQRVQSASIIERVLEKCSKEECDFIDKYYHNNYYTYRVPSRVYKFEEGEEGMRRRIYISFECARGQKVPIYQQRPANHKGSNKIHLIRATKMFIILFA
uniref:Stimulator of interferon genes protein n=1 Tax=Steinernema glaseri TaxID=37863 RepID=A0A1I7YXB0_9BILA